MSITGYLQVMHREARKVYDRIFATIYGHCVGDALGLLTENLSKEDAKKVDDKQMLISQSLILTLVWFENFFLQCLIFSLGIIFFYFTCIYRLVFKALITYFILISAFYFKCYTLTISIIKYHSDINSWQYIPLL